MNFAIRFRASATALFDHADRPLGDADLLSKLSLCQTMTFTIGLEFLCANFHVFLLARQYWGANKFFADQGKYRMLAMDLQQSGAHNALMQFNVRQYRKLKNWTQQRLAKESGVSQGTISLIETGEQEPGAATLFQLASALGVLPHLLPDEFKRGEAIDEIEFLLAPLTEAERKGAAAILRAYVESVPRG